MVKIRQKILNKIDIVDEMRNYLDLEREGQNYKCICPFHNDTNPSLVVSEQKQIFKCFVCGEGGTIIEFIQKFEKISYNASLEKLAKKAGIKVIKEQKNNLNIILDNINLFYQKILLNSELGEKSLEYLEIKRKLDKEDIEKFQIGYSPKYSHVLYDFICEHLKEVGISLLELEKLGIFSEKNFDILNDRITFPIYDHKDKLVGFSGRSQTNHVKYLNSKQSEVFNKKQILYNLNEILKNNYLELIIVEGFFDVITATKYGYPNTVATMGVAFSKEHIKLLKNANIKKIYLGFDNDNAGKKATSVTAKLLIENGFEIKILTYGDSKDIDEYLNENENNFLKEEAVEYPIYIVKDIDEKKLTIDDKSKLINEICGVLKTYENITKRNLIVSEVSKKLNIQENVILNQIQNYNKQTHIKLENPNIKELNANKKSNVLVFDKEKILMYLIANDYRKFLQLEEYIKKEEFTFWLYLQDYKKLKKMYEEKDNLDYITLLDELEFYNEIDKEFKKYGKLELDDIDINNYFNKDKKKKIDKMKKLF